MSGSTQDCPRSARPRHTLQLGWGTFGNGVALNLSVTRTRSSGLQQRRLPRLRRWIIYSAPWRKRRPSRPVAELPARPFVIRPSVSLLANHSRGTGRQLSGCAVGSVGDEQPVSYGLNSTTDDDRQQSIWGGNLQTRLPYANVTGSFSPRAPVPTRLPLSQGRWWLTAAA